MLRRQTSYLTSPWPKFLISPLLCSPPPLAFNYSLSKIVFLAVITQSPLAFDYSSPRIAFYYAIPPLAFPGTFHNGFHKTASTRFQLSLIIQRTPLVWVGAKGNIEKHIHDKHRFSPRHMESFKKFPSQKWILNFAVPNILQLLGTYQAGTLGKRSSTQKDNVEGKLKCLKTLSLSL